MDDILQYIDDQQNRYINLVQQACRQPSISAQDVGIMDMAMLCQSMLESVGADVQIITMDNANPVILGSISGNGSRVINIYNHYDVQPPEPLNLWESEPFAADVRNGRIWARGISDNKGHLVARICAVDAWRHVRGELPLTVRFIYEGEEEIGSPNLPRFVDAYRNLITPADGCIWEGGYKDFDGRINLYCGVKGMCYVELSARSASTDMHSSKASIVPDAAWRLIWALSTLKGPDERIQIDGFYDRVKPLTPREEDALAHISFDEEPFLQSNGLGHFLLNLSGMSLKVKDMFEPTCTVCGFESGYTGSGIKTVLPCSAVAKIDMRLVPDQRPEEIFSLLRAHLDRHGFSDIEARLLASENPAKSDLDAPIIGAVSSVVQRLYGHDPVIIPMQAGTGPMYPLCQALGIASVAGPGGGNPESRIHAPNENMFVNDFINAIKGMAMLFEEFASI